MSHGMDDEAGCGVCVYADGEPSEFCSEAIVTAKKSHKCCECRRAIQAGEQYERVAGKWEGDFSVYKTCLLCREIRRAFCCDGWIYGLLWEGMNEVFDEFTTGCLAKLTTAAAKALVVERWQEWKL